MFLIPRQPSRVKQTTLWWVMQLGRVSKTEHGVELNPDVSLLSVVQYQSLLMARFKVIGMNWGLLFASLATRATIWFQQALHSGLALQMAKEEENGQRQILSANW